MRTLVVSDLHLGSRLERDVLRRPAALAALLAALEDVDRLVLLGDVVELLEGRPRAALGLAMPVLEAIGAVMGREREVVVVPGNHDHLLVRPWLRERARGGRRIGLRGRVARASGRRLQALTDALRPARVSVRYPGLTLRPGVYATHGHYLDRHLMPTLPTGLARGPLAPIPERARPEDYERSSGPSAAAVQGLLATALPGAVGDPVDVVAGTLRRTALAAVPLAAALPFAGLLAPFSAGLLGYQFRRAGLPAMGLTARTLGVRAEHVVFGHLHRLGPLPGDDPGDWAPGGGACLHNTGSWVYEPLLLAGVSPTSPYWPGGAIVVESDGPPRAVNLLQHVPREALAP